MTNKDLERFQQYCEELGRWNGYNEASFSSNDFQSLKSKIASSMKLMELVERLSKSEKIQWYGIMLLKILLEKSKE